MVKTPKTNAKKNNTQTNAEIGDTFIGDTFEVLAEASLQGILVHRDYRPLFVNDVFAHLYGWHSKEELLTLASVEILLASPGFAGDDVGFRAGAVPLEFERRRRDGSIVWVRSVTRTIDWDGEPAELVIQLDISEQRRVQHALTVSEREISSYFDAPVAGIGILSIDGHLIRCNEMLGRLMGCVPDKLLGLSFREVTAPEFLSVSEAAYQCLLAGVVERLTFEKDYLRPDGARFEAEVTLACVRDHRSRPGYVVAMIQDVSHRRAVERELRLAKEAADRANASKTRFLATASHDLRQPLMALSMFVSALESINQNPELTAVISKIKSSADEVTALLNALLDISRLDAEMVTPSPSVFRLEPVFERLEREFAPIAEAADLFFRIVPSQVAVVTDTVLLTTILRNLVSNAVRYTERGGILLGCRRQGEFVRIEVWDSGIGIAEDDLDLIFEEFHQLHKRGRNRAVGMGLGLAMVSRVARLLGLPVGVRSVPERGSVFSVTVARATVAVTKGDVPMVAPALVQSSKHKRSALIAVVDDEEAVCDGLRTVLECWGYRVIAERSDQELLAALDRAVEGPDLVIADIHLIPASYNDDTLPVSGRDDGPARPCARSQGRPCARPASEGSLDKSTSRLDGMRDGCDGIEFISFLQQKWGQVFPALLLTGDITPDGLRRAEAKGLPVLHKPVNGQELKEVISRLLGQTSRVGNSGAEPTR